MLETDLEDELDVLLDELLDADVELDDSLAVEDVELVEVEDEVADVRLLVVWLDFEDVEDVLPVLAEIVEELLVIVCVVLLDEDCELADDRELVLVETLLLDDQEHSAVLVLDVDEELSSSSAISQTTSPCWETGEGRRGNVGSAANERIDAAPTPSVPVSRSSRRKRPCLSRSNSARTALAANAVMLSGLAPGDASIAFWL